MSVFGKFRAVVDIVYICVLDGARVRTFNNGGLPLRSTITAYEAGYKLTHIIL